MLLAYSKLKLYEELLASEIHEDDHLCCELQTYFPKILRQRFAAQINEHSLRREILATHITNSVINRMGSTYCARIQEDTGASAADIARAYTIAKQIFGTEAIWEAIEALDNKIPTQVQVEMIGDSRRLIERATRWLLHNRKRPLEVAATIEQFTEPVQTIGGHLQRLLGGHAHDKLEAHIENLIELKIPQALAQRIAELDPMFSSLDIGEVARSIELDIDRVGQTYFDLGLNLDLDLLNDHIAQLPRQTHWQRSVRGLLRDDLNKAQRAMTAQILSTASMSDNTENRIQDWLNENQENSARYRSIMAELKTTSKVDMAMLSVAVRELREMAEK